MTYVPQNPDYARLTELVTYQDAVERILAYWDRANSGRDAYFARQSISEAMRRLGQYRWKWYRGNLFITTSPSYNTGRVQYVHADRQLIIEGGTWPANAELGHIVIWHVTYPVVKRISDTVLELPLNHNPGEDLDQGTVYTWFRNHYTLPPDIFELMNPRDASNTSGTLEYLHPDRAAAIQIKLSYQPQTNPWAWSLIRDHRRHAMAVVIEGPPKTAITYVFTASRYPRPVKVEKYDQGTLTLTSGSATATGTGTAFGPQHVGCVLRVSSNDSPPTSQYGARPNALSLEMDANPAAMTRIVTAVTSATMLVLDEAPDVSLTGKPYVLSDPIDVDWNTCGIYFDRMTEYFFARAQLGIDREEHQRLRGQVDQAFKEAVDAERVMDPLPNGLTMFRVLWDRVDYDGLRFV